LPSLAPLHTVHPEHIRSLPSLAPLHTVHPEHKKPASGGFELIPFGHMIKMLGHYLPMHIMKRFNKFIF
jgi:hypothetical protein